jgi:hypothetical protein
VKFMTDPGGTWTPGAEFASSPLTRLMIRTAGAAAKALAGLLAVTVPPVGVVAVAVPMFVY